MGENIDLGSFNWDISKIEAQIIENRKQLEQYSAALALNKKALNEQKTQYLENTEKIKIMQGVQATANKLLNDGTISQAEYAKTIADTNAVISEAKQKTIEIGAAQSANIKTILDTENAMKELRLENNELNKLMSAGRTEIAGTEGAYRELNKELNALKTEAKNLGAELVNLKRSGKENTDEYRELEAEWKRVSAQADELNQDFKNIDSAVGDNQRNVGNYKEAFTGAFSEIKEGASAMMSGDVKGGFETIKGGMSGIKTGAAELFNFLKANPWVLLVTGIIAYAKEMYEYNKGIAENVKLTETLFSRAGEKSTEYLDTVRTNIQGLVDTFGVQFQDVANAVDDLVDTGRAKDELEALQIIKENIVKAPDANEFINTLGETAQKAEEVGMSMKEVIAAKMQMDASGQNNAFFDAIQKGYKSLTEGGDKVKASLSGAFGAAFSDQILNGVRNGSLTTIQALEQIRKKGEEVGLDNSQKMDLAIQLFGKSALAAGGYAKVMDAVHASTVKASEPLTALQKGIYDLATANQELERAKDKAFKSDSVLSFQRTATLAWTEVKTKFYDLVGFVVKYGNIIADKFTVVIATVINSFQRIPYSFRQVVNGIKSDFQSLGSIALTAGKAIKDALSFNVEGAAQKFNQLKNQLANFHSATAKAYKDQIAQGKKDFDRNTKNVADYRAGSAAAQKAENEAEGKKSGGGGMTGAEYADKQKADAKAAKEAAAERAKAAKESAAEAVREQKRLAEEAKKRVEEEAKRTMDIAKQTADQQTEIAKSELANYILVNAAKFKDDKDHTAARLQLQKDYFDEVKKRQLVVNEDERKAKELAIQQQIDAFDKIKNLSANDIEQRKILQQNNILLNQEYADKAVAIEEDTSNKKLEVQKKYDEYLAEQKKLSQAIDYQQRLLDIQKQGENEYAVKSEQASYQRDEDLAKLEEQRAEDSISLDNYEAQKNLIRSTYAAQEKQIEKDVNDYKIQSRSQVLGGLSDLFGKESALGKVFAGAEIINNTAMNASKAFAQAAVFASNPLTASLAPNAYIQGGIIIATGAMQLAKLVAPKKAARGMLISGPSHDGGGVPISTPNGMIEAEGGEPILTKRAFQMYPKLISDINVAGGGVPLYARGGLAGVSPMNLSTVQKSLTQKSEPVYLDSSAVAQIASAIYNGSQTGISDLSSNRSIAQGANF